MARKPEGHDYYKVHDYTHEPNDRSHFCAESMYERICKEQYDRQPMYCWPGNVDESGAMVGEHRNTQNGP